jgi:hypothetical protein
MIIKNANEYNFIEFKKSITKNKKYDAFLRNKTTNKIKRVPFGSVNYQQYEDATGLNLYSHLNHYDKKRRTLYRKRHEGEQKNKYSSGWFSWFYLW